jgi:lipopolysaccharide/colanic/teichoic acid biosynthesis glycosyltransferase
MNPPTAGTLPSELLSSECTSALSQSTTFWPNRVRRQGKSPKSTAELVARQEPILVHPAGNQSFVYLILKRIIDILGAIVLLTLLSPVLLVTLLVLVVTTKGRPFFVQERVGYCGRRFRIVKFRSMIPNAEALQKLVVNEQDGPIFKNATDPRVTRFGFFLRTTSLDETPQLINVLLGQMSLVGPRPHPVSEVAEYTPAQRQRLATKPGLTCLWQVEGRSDLGFEEGVTKDLWYIQNQGLRTDLQLLFRTPWSVLSRRGAY